jgi:lipid-A-disaccharide synthase-like uncharacterized protein
MNLFLIATNLPHQHGFLGLDWSYLVIIGFIGNLVFSARFIIQWIASEKKGEVVIPVSFWYFSIAGSLIVALYFLLKRDPVGILGYLPNSIVYVRNLYLHRKKVKGKTLTEQIGKEL